MMDLDSIGFPDELLSKLCAKTPTLWINEKLGSSLNPSNTPLIAEIETAQNRLLRSRDLLITLFPELEQTQGVIESELVELSQLQQHLDPTYHTQHDQKWFLKSDHALPIAGSVKARGGFHEVIAVAEKIAIENHLIEENENLVVLASDQAKALFSQYSIAVGSTGNLGLSIGIMAAALGFSSIVHMSVDAKEWKKERLRRRGVKVIEHSGDYVEAVEAGRKEALSNPKCHFVDDEQSILLFLGYAAAAQHLAAQLKAQNRIVDKEHPLFVYIPCGVGGAPGGITYGLKAIFGEHVHCFFAEPVASPCMLVQLASGQDTPISVYDIGLDNRTEADGLAVGQASYLVSPIMQSLLSGVFTVSDTTLYKNLHMIKATENIELEPSAAASLHGPVLLSQTDEGQRYLTDHHIVTSHATHIIWSTGGSLVPSEEMQKFQKYGEDVYLND